MAEQDGGFDLNKPVAAVPAPGGNVRFSDPPTQPNQDALTRKWVSQFLLYVLAGIIVAAALGLAMILPSAGTDYSKPDARVRYLIDVLNIVFGPVIALVSSVVGFYFGAKTAIETPAAAQPRQPGNP
jgi:hypothetical protein